jgi:hypothetical protein
MAMVISEAGMLIMWEWLLRILPRKEQASGEKKGDLPYDKAPLMNLKNDRSSLTVTFFEAFNTTCSINEFLFAGIERVACRTDLCADLFFCGACQECITAQALNGNLGIIWVDAFFHLFLLQ